MRKIKLAMKIGGEYKVSLIGLRQWLKFARQARVHADELIGKLSSMAKRLPDTVTAARTRARKDGLDNAVIDRLAKQLIQRAEECQHILTGA
jgi:serine/threonine-protein kinase HipA